MASSPSIVTAVDLSRLPAPAVVEQLSYDAIRTLMIAKFQELMPEHDAIVESDPVIKALEVGAYQVLLLRQNFNERAVSMLLAKAAGTDLDHLAAFYGVARLEVSPANPTTGAAAVMEDDDRLRRRVQLAPDGFSVAGPVTAYIFHALTADATVLDASATSPVPREVLVSLLGSTGDGTATPQQIAAVEAVLTHDEVRPLTDLVAVQSATIIPFDIVATLFLNTGPDPAIILAAAQAALAAYLASRRKIGRLISATGIAGALQVEGVETVQLVSPAADIIIGDTQAGHAATISIGVA
ncbi:phage-related baseplate assembly protein [Sphingobium sp. JAI105]|uniref:baseplate assembly protein n=1 Tax=Sphingobium sp. JAI105 TaxID=2787715 RepID=UPI0018CB06E3|nr:baseplate J/gp47 family protein [Sphingobium sp. JAI105]MBG6118757.1 phage-related baseplate assembly protein [Sphingobium sp. JAI105]